MTKDVMLWLARTLLAVRLGRLVEAQALVSSLPQKTYLSLTTTSIFGENGAEAAPMPQNLMHFIFALFPFLRVV